MLYTTPPTDKLTTILQQICHIAMPERNISTCHDVGMWQIFVRWWWICCTTSCRIVVECPLVVLYNMSVAGVRVVEFGTKTVTKRKRKRLWTSDQWHERDQNLKTETEQGQGHRVRYQHRDRNWRADSKISTKHENMSPPSADMTRGRPSSCRAFHGQAPTVN